MSKHTHTKRIENTIRKIGDKYELATKKVFVPNKGSKKMFRHIEVNPVQQTVTICGTPPALKDIKAIYETTVEIWYKTMYGHKKLKRSLNKQYRTAV